LLPDRAERDEEERERERERKIRARKELDLGQNVMLAVSERLAIYLATGVAPGDMPAVTERKEGQDPRRWIVREKAKKDRFPLFRHRHHPLHLLLGA